ncbi:MAG: hypothetical protein ACKPBU_01355 [Alphaproteobacteria bacterium]
MFGSATATTLDPVSPALLRLAELEEQGAWPNGPRHLGIDAIGLLVLVGLARAQGDAAWLDRAEALVKEVDRVLRRRRGYRAGEGPLRDVQSFRELSLWVFALAVLGEERPAHSKRALEIVREIHRAFVAPGLGVHARRGEDLDQSRSDGGFGRLDPVRGAVVWRLVDPVALAEEIGEMDRLVQASLPRLRLDRDVSAGTALWLAHFFPAESWARTLRERALGMLDRTWIDRQGCFARGPQARSSRWALGNYAITLGLQSHGLHPDRVSRAHLFWDTQRWRGADRGIAPRIMACAALLPDAMIRPAPCLAAVSAAGAP